MTGSSVEMRLDALTDCCLASPGDHTIQKCAFRLAIPPLGQSVLALRFEPSTSIISRGTESLLTLRWRELDSNHRSRREREGRRQRPAALAGHLIKDLSPDRTVLSLSHGRLVIGANCNYALPRQLLLFLTSKFGFCRLRLTESATRDWRVRPIYSSGGWYVKLRTYPILVSGSNQRQMGGCTVGRFDAPS